MANQKIVYYNLDELDNQNAQFNLLYGERSNGKSYQLKHKKGILPYLESCVKDSINNHERFMLVRRLKEEIKPEKIEQYFQDIDIYKLTDGKYNTFSLYKGKVYLAVYDPESKPQLKRGDFICYVVALSTEQTYAGASYLDVKNIIFEEFMARSGYLTNEPDKLMNLYSTVDRKRGTTRLWLVGNTISRVCPYIYEWDLHHIVSKQKQGTIECTYVKTGAVNEETGEEEAIKIAIEYCKDSGRSSHVIGKHKAMLNTGSWQSDPQPHLPYSYNEYEMSFRLLFKYQNFMFIGERLLKDGEAVWYIYPYKGKIDNDILVISDEVRTSRLWQRNIYNVSINNDVLHRLLDTFRESCIFYASDLCGTDFKQVIDFEIKR